MVPLTMLLARYRVLLAALIALIVAWSVATAGFRLADRWKASPEKVVRFLRETDLSQLQGRARQRALDRLASLLNRLTPEERREARLSAAWDRWLAVMTDAEKADLLEATLPSGVQQMLASFEELPEERRLRAINEAFQRLRSTRQQMASEDPFEQSGPGDTNGLAALSPELQERAIRSGLKAFYSESSAQTRAELAPLLEEIQRTMESGRLFRGRTPPGSPNPTPGGSPLPAGSDPTSAPPPR